MEKLYRLTFKRCTIATFAATIELRAVPDLSRQRSVSQYHDVYLTISTATQLGLGVYGHARIRSCRNPALLLPGRVLPHPQGLDSSHVLLSWAAFEALGLASCDKVEVASCHLPPSLGQPSGDGMDGSAVTMALKALKGGDDDLPVCPLHAVQRAALGLRLSVSCVILVPFLGHVLRYVVLDVRAASVGWCVVDEHTVITVVAGGEEEDTDSTGGAGAHTHMVGDLAHHQVLDDLIQTVRASLDAWTGTVGGGTFTQSLRVSGVLLSGPPGVGKTHILRCLASRLKAGTPGVASTHTSASDLLTSVAGGEDVSHLLLPPRHVEKQGLVIMIDDFDVLISDDDDGDAGFTEAADTLRAVQTALLSLVGSVRCCWVLITRESLGASGARGAGGRVGWLLSLQGLYDQVVEVPRPDADARAAILRSVMSELPIAQHDRPQQQPALHDQGEGLRETKITQLADSTGGFVAADLVWMCETAAFNALLRAESEGGNWEEATVTWDDLMTARAAATPSQLSGLDVVTNKRSGLSWDSVGGYDDVKARLKKLIQWPWQHRATFERMGLAGVPGILLHGPSGCGKSMLAQVIAAETRASFVHVRAADIFSPFLGESEARLRSVFSRARGASPCILFLDELDAMAAQRGHGGGGSSGGSEDASSVYARVLSTLLNEMDGVSGRASQVLVLAATNRREAVDAALLRPGRLQESVLVPLPDPERDFVPIVRMSTAGMPLSEDMDIEMFVLDVVRPLARERGVTPADLVALCREAGMECLRESLDSREVARKHFDRAAALMWS